MDAEGTTPGMEEVEQRRERLPRAMQEQLSGVPRTVDFCKHLVMKAEDG